MQPLFEFDKTVVSDSLNTKSIDPLLLVFEIRYRVPEGVWVADLMRILLNKSRVVKVDWQPLSAHPPPLPHWWLNGVNRRDGVLTPVSGQNLRPITFSVCCNCRIGMDSAGEKGKKKPNQKAQLQSTWPSRSTEINDFPPISRRSISPVSLLYSLVKDTGAFLCRTLIQIELKQTAVKEKMHSLVCFQSWLPYQWEAIHLCLAPPCTHIKWRQRLS